MLDGVDYDRRPPSSRYHASSTHAAPENDTSNRGAKRWFKKNWPYVVAATLVLGIATFITIDTVRSSPSSPEIVVSP